MNILFERFTLPEQLSRVIYNSPSVIIPTSKEVLFELIFGNEYTGKIEVLYDIHGKAVKEAEVVRCKNGAAETPVAKITRALFRALRRSCACAAQYSSANRRSMPTPLSICG